MQAIAHGIDLVDFSRIQDMVDNHGSHFLDRVFTPYEQGYARQRNHTEKLAGRFAAKEAVLKLLGTGWRGKIAWTDVEVINNPLGQPEVHLHGQVQQIAEQMGIGDIALSITHTADYAIASAVAIKEHNDSK